MSLVLAIEPDAAQAERLGPIVATVAGARLLVVPSPLDAHAAIAAEVPDLVLLSPLLAPGDEASLMASLRALPGAAHLQTLTIPTLEDAPVPAATFFRLRRKRASASVGCDPAAF